MRRCLRATLLLLASAVLAAGDPPREGGNKGAPGKGIKRERPESPEAGKGEPKGPRGGPERRGGPGGPRGQRGGDHAANMMRSFDENKDERITFEEFRKGEKISHLPEEGKRRLFDHFDRDKDGVIVRAELPRSGGPMRGDKNGDGKISREEFFSNPRLANVPPEKRREMFRRMDTNKDEFLSPEDWPKRSDGSRGWERRPAFLDEKRLAELDTDKDGALTFEEWRKNPRFEGQSEERLREMFGRHDRNDDGKLDKADRPEWMNRRGPGPRPEGDRPPGRPPGGPGSRGVPPQRPKAARPDA